MLIQERRSTLYFIIIKTSYGGESLRFYDREETTLSLSFSKPKKGDKRKQNGREKDGLVYVYNLYARVYI